MPSPSPGMAKALIGRFLLPSERKALSAFASIQEEFATPFSKKKLSEAVGKPLTTDDDVLEVALDSYLGNNSSTLERLPPEIRKIAESVGTRSKKVAELEARGVPIPRTLLSKEEGTQDILAKVGERFDQSRKNLGWENPPNSLQDLVEYPKHPQEFLWGVDPKNPVPGIRERYKDWATFVHTSLEDKEIRAIMRYARVRDYIDPDRAFPPEGAQEFKKWVKILGVSGFASQLFLPEEAEAAPKLKASQLKALAEEAWPITKELLAKGGPIDFDHARRYWARRLGGGGMFWDRDKDPERFKTWVRPWMEKALESGERDAIKAKEFIALGDREGRPYYYELALQLLHRIHTHDSTPVKAVEELIDKFKDKPAVAKALLSHSPKEYKEVMEKTFKEWDFATIIGALGLGAGTLGVGADEAEAGFLPKKLTQAAAKKLGNLSSASIKLKGAELMGKTIKDVRLGNEPWRYISFEDGTYLPIHKKYIASLVSSEGEKTYTSMYDLLPKGQQKLMLERSHALRMADILPSKELSKGLNVRASHLQELGEEAPERVMTKFRGKQTLLPTLYAEGVKKHGEPRLDSLPQIFRKIEAVERPAPSVSPPSRRVVKATPASPSKPQLSMREKSIRNLERSLKEKGRLPPGDEYILRRLKGASIEEAGKELKLVSKESIERMVKRIIEESR